MHDFAHLLDRTIHPLQPAIILIALIAWGFAAVGQASTIRSRLPISPQPLSRMFITGASIFVAIIGGELAISEVIRFAALDEIRPKLSADIEAVTVNGTPFEATEGFIAALRGMHGTFGHHSHPTTEYRLLLKTSNGPLALELRRDSQDPHEYWVFYPEFNATKLQDVGHVFTDALDIIRQRSEFGPQ
jgi:hypothetical protein